MVCGVAGAVIGDDSCADAAPGDTNGQGVAEVWYVLDGAGDAIGSPADSEKFSPSD